MESNLRMEVPAVAYILMDVESEAPSSCAEVMSSSVWFVPVLLGVVLFLFAVFLDVFDMIEGDLDRLIGV